MIKSIIRLLHRPSAEDRSYEASRRFYEALTESHAAQPTLVEFCEGDTVIVSFDPPKGLTSLELKHIVAAQKSILEEANPGIRFVINPVPGDMKVKLILRQDGGQK
jgi:hypothetical protein